MNIRNNQKIRHNGVFFILVSKEIGIDYFGIQKFLTR